MFLQGFWPISLYIQLLERSTARPKGHRDSLATFIMVWLTFGMLIGYSMTTSVIQHVRMPDAPRVVHDIEDQLSVGGLCHLITTERPIHLVE